jgi:putative transposase
MLSGKRFKRISIMGLYNQNTIYKPVVYENTAKSITIIKYFKKIFRYTKRKMIVVLDNAKIHHSKLLSELFKKHGHILMFLPPYSPDLNKIEKYWGNLKRKLSYRFDKTKELVSNIIEQTGAKYVSNLISV